MRARSVGLLLVASLVFGCSDDDSGGGSGGSSGGGAGGVAGTGGGTGGVGGTGGTGGTGGGAGIGGAGGTAGAGGSAGVAGMAGVAGSAGTAGAAGAAGTAGAAGSAGAAGAGGGPCILSITDDFNDGQLGPLWDSSIDTGMQLAETGGEIEITWPAAPSGVAYAGIASKSTYDLTACSALVHVTKLPSASTDAYIHLSIDDAGNAVEFFVGAGTLYAFLWQGINSSELASATFDSSQHAWWRLRESAGKFYWDTSGDGKTWTVLASADAPFSLASGTLMLGGGTYQAEPSPPGSAAFDDLNLPPP